MAAEEGAAGLLGAANPLGALMGGLMGAAAPSSSATAGGSGAGGALGGTADLTNKLSFDNSVNMAGSPKVNMVKYLALAGAVIAGLYFFRKK